jgi:hypothetical protein
MRVYFCAACDASWQVADDDRADPPPQGKERPDRS